MSTSLNAHAPAIMAIPVIELWNIKRKYDLIVPPCRKRFVWNCVCFGEGFWEQDWIKADPGSVSTASQALCGYCCCLV